MDWAYTASGFLVGMLVGLTGVGGGSLMTPLLVLLFGFSPAVAVGTDLLFAAITKMGGIWVHGRRGNIEWKAVGLLASGSLPASILTIGLLRYMEASGWEADKFILPLIGVAVILTAFALLFKNQLVTWSQQRQGQTPRRAEPQLAPLREAFAAEAVIHSQQYEKANIEEIGRDTEIDVAAGRRGPRAYYLTISLGALLGFLVTLTSIGAGAIGVVALFLLYPLLPTVKIVGTDIAHAVPLTLVAGLGHMHMGNVDFALLGALLLGSLPGIYLGSHLSASIPEKLLRLILATMLILIGIKFISS